MRVGEKIRVVRQARSLKIADVEAKAGLSEGNLSRIERGHQWISEEKLFSLANALGVQVADFFSSSPIEIEKSDELEGRVPMLKWSHIGQGNSDVEGWLACPVDHGIRTFALRVRGESMYTTAERPSLADGDVVFVDPDRQPQHRSLVIVQLPDAQEAMLRRLLIDGKQHYLEAINPAWPNRISAVPEETIFHGVVIAKFEQYE